MTQEPGHLTPIADAPAAETPEARSVRQARELKELAAVGMWLVHDLQAQAQKPAGERPTHETLALAFDRYARAVRLTHMLENRLFAEAEARARFAPPPPRPVTTVERRRGVLTQLTDEMIEAQDRKDRRFDADEVRERAERLIEEELEDEDITGRPILEVVALVCETLGVTPDWSLWDPRRWPAETHGLTPAELSDDACPAGPPKRLTDDWPAPGTHLPLPTTSPSPPGSSRGPIREPTQTPGPRDKPEDDAIGVRDAEPKTFKGPP